MTAYSLRRRLLGWLLISTFIIGILALADTYREAVATSSSVSDRVLAGSALAIAEQVRVAADGSLSVDIPFSALEMLSSAAQDRVFYRIDQIAAGPDAAPMITGYTQLPAPALLPPGDRLILSDGRFNTDPIRIATLYRAATTGLTSIPFAVTVAETTSARRQLAGTILLRSAFRLALMIAGAALIVWQKTEGASPPLAMALAFAAALIWAGYSVLSRRFGSIPTEAVAVYCLATAGLSGLAHLALERTVWPISATGWMAVLALGIGPVGAAFFTWDIGMKRGDIQVLGAASYAAPLLSTLALVATGHATPTPGLALSATLIVGGAGLAAFASGRR